MKNHPVSSRRAAMLAASFAAIVATGVAGSSSSAVAAPNAQPVIQGTIVGINTALSVSGPDVISIKAGEAHLLSEYFGISKGIIAVNGPLSSVSFQGAGGVKIFPEDTQGIGYPNMTVLAAMSRSIKTTGPGSFTITVQLGAETASKTSAVVIAPAPTTIAPSTTVAPTTTVAPVTTLAPATTVAPIPTTTVVAVTAATTPVTTPASTVPATTAPVTTTPPLAPSVPTAPTTTPTGPTTPTTQSTGSGQAGGTSGIVVSPNGQPITIIITTPSNGVKIVAKRTTKAVKKLVKKPVKIVKRTHTIVKVKKAH